MPTATNAPVFLLDVNVLIALSLPNHVHHRRSRRWWTTVDAWATCPVTESAFARLVMNPSVVGRSVSSREALAMLEAMRKLPGHTFLSDASSLVSASISLALLATSRQVADVHLVNLAASHASVLATLDAAIPAMLAESDRRHVLVLP